MSLGGGGGMRGFKKREKKREERGNGGAEEKEIVKICIESADTVKKKQTKIRACEPNISVSGGREMTRRKDFGIENKMRKRRTSKKLHPPPPLKGKSIDLRGIRGRVGKKQT